MIINLLIFFTGKSIRAILYIECRVPMIHCMGRSKARLPHPNHPNSADLSLCYSANAITTCSRIGSCTIIDTGPCKMDSVNRDLWRVFQLRGDNTYTDMSDLRSQTAFNTTFTGLLRNKSANLMWECALT